MMVQGRPRQAGIDAQIIQAMSDLVIERGYSSVTVNHLVERAGTNKPAFYRRYRRLADVVPHALAALQQDVSAIDTGSLTRDLFEFQRRQRELFSAPLVVRGLAGWLVDVGADPENAKPFAEQFQMPRRVALRSILARASARGEVAADPDVDAVTDILTAPLIMRAMIPGLPPIDEELVAHTVRVALSLVSQEAIAFSSARKPKEGGLL